MAASLSRNDFYHPPRRNKSTLLPPHRPNVRTHRSHNGKYKRRYNPILDISIEFDFEFKYNNNVPSGISKVTIRLLEIKEPRYRPKSHHADSQNARLYNNSKRICTILGPNIMFCINDCVYPSPGHIAINMDQGALGMNAARTTNAILVETADDASDSSDVPGVPSFVRRGLWVSFALSVTFAAGLWPFDWNDIVAYVWSFYHLAAFQHYWLIFVIFSSLSITFFSAACILSFRRSSRRPNIPATQLVTTSANEIEITHMDRTVKISHFWIEMFVPIVIVTHVVAGSNCPRCSSTTSTISHCHLEPEGWRISTALLWKYKQLSCQWS